jgi:PadR family transcriptional regulator PadR
VTRHLDNFEELCLLAIRHTQPDAYGVPIRHALDDATGREVTVGELYAALERLEQAGCVESWNADPTPERGGRQRRYYRLTEGGIEALARAEAGRLTVPRPAFG